MADYYGDLGISKGATEAEIKKAYRKMAQKHHPDVNAGNKTSEEKFKKASEAYEVLSDTTKKSRYDQFGQTANGQGGSGFGGGGGGGAGFNDFGGSDFMEDFMSSFFGGGGGGGRSRASRQRNTRGNDLETHIQITFEQSIHGVNKEIQVTKAEACDPCSGQGGSGKTTCNTCHGSGQVAKAQRTPLGVIQMRQECPDCHGAGKRFANICSICHGEGRTRKNSKIKVKIPAGVYDGANIRLSGQGDAGHQGGTPGDLYILISVSPSKDFIRKNNDIYSDQHIHILQAIFGDEIEIKTAHNPVKLKIPSGTQSEQVFRIKDHGAPVLQGHGKGMHYVKIIVDTPKKLSNKEGELYKQLADESGLNIKAEKKGFFDSLWK